jgi:hypothetical protein
MTSYLFGAGTVIGKRVDVTNAPPAFMGTIQDFEFDITQNIKELIGQFKAPVAIAAAETKYTCKAKFARIQASSMNYLQSGSTTAGMLELADTEQQTIPTTTAAILPSFTVSQGTAAYTEDFGVFYSATGVALTPTVSTATPTSGYYIPGNTGIYTFGTGDRGLVVNVYYQYTVTTGVSVPMANTLMGQQPSFELIAKEKFSYLGSQKEMVIKLNACVSSKLTFPFKNVDFLIQEMDITAFADAANNIGTLSFSE